jgi:two-component system response regulator FixJ
MFPGGNGAGPAAAGMGDPCGPLIAVVDDDKAARLSTAWFLEGEGYRVQTFASGDAYLAAPLAERPDCTLLDMRMPGRSGLEILRVLAARCDAAPVLMLTGHGDVAMAVAAMKLNAADFILKPYVPTALVDSIERALKRGEQARAALAVDRNARAVVEGLSERQRQVLAGIVRGDPNKVIAWELGLSVRTIEAYRAQLFVKLGVRSTAEAVRMALAGGLEDVARRAREAAGRGRPAPGQALRLRPYQGELPI